MARAAWAFCSMRSKVTPSEWISWITRKTSSTRIGGEAQGRFVHEEKRGPGHETSCDGKHLLFAAGKSSAFLSGALL